MTPEYQASNSSSYFTLYSLPQPELRLCCCSYSDFRLIECSRITLAVIENINSYILKCKTFYFRKIKIISIYILEQKKTNDDAKIKYSEHSTGLWIHKEEDQKGTCFSTSHAILQTVVAELNPVCAI